MKKVSIITVNFNQPKVTEELLQSIFTKSKYPGLEIIVVDNGSEHDPTAEWGTLYATVKFIRSATNLGFAGGNNLGIRAATGDYLFLVNNDTEFTEGLVEQLVNTLDEHSEAGMVSPKIRYFDKPDVLQYAGYTKMNYFTARNNCVGQFETDMGQYDQLTGETAFGHGAAMMVRREAMEKAGMMSEIYFLYYEEMDWCEHIRKAGYTIRVNMQALIYHKESVSVGRNSPLKEFFMNRNRILFIRRNCPLGVRMVFWPYILFVVTPRNMLNYMKNGQWGFIPILIKAITWNFTNSIQSTNLGYPVKR